MTKYLLDTNVLTRFLLGDHDTHSPAARKLFGEACDGKCTLILSAGVRCIKRDEMLDALNRFASTKCDFLDCYLASLATSSNDHVATFDKDFGNL